MKILMTVSTGFVGTALCQDLQRPAHSLPLVRPGTAAEKTRVPGCFDVNLNPAPENSRRSGGRRCGCESCRGLDCGWSLDSRAQATAACQPRGYQRARSSRHSPRWRRGRARSCPRPASATTGAVAIKCSRRESARHDFLKPPGTGMGGEAAKAEAIGIRVVRARFGSHFGKTRRRLAAHGSPFLWAPAGKSFRRTVDELGNASGCRRHPAICAGERRGARADKCGFTATGAQRPSSPRCWPKTLHRPALFPAPAFALRLLLGEMANELLLSSQRVMPTQLEKLGYRFLHPDLAGALAAVLAVA